METSIYFRVSAANVRAAEVKDQLLRRNSGYVRDVHRSVFDHVEEFEDPSTAWSEFMNLWDQTSFGLKKGLSKKRHVGQVLIQ